MSALPEPKRLHSVVRDNQGDLWARGRSWWHCQTNPGGKLPYGALVERYGPLFQDAGTEREEQSVRARGMVRR